MTAQLKGFVLTLVASTAFSCGGDHAHGVVGAATGATCPAGLTLTYESFGRAFMQTYCTGCHASTVPAASRQGAPSDHNFDSVDDIRMMLEHIDGVAAAGPAAMNMAMPPAGHAPTPSDAERQSLGEWLACGAP